MTALAGELTVRQFGEMLRERGMRLDGLWWSRRLGGWAVDVSGIDALIVASDLHAQAHRFVERVVCAMEEGGEVRVLEERAGREAA